MTTDITTTLPSIDAHDLTTVSGGLAGPADLILAPIQRANERELACKSLQAAKTEAARRPGDQQAQQWVDYKRQFCPFNPLSPRTW